MASITLKGNPINTCGDLPAVGTKAPGFTLVDTDLNDVSLDSFAGKNVVLNIFPSIDTPVCANSVRKFNEAAAGENTVVLCISMDLPFAHKRFCGAEGLEEERRLAYVAITRGRRRVVISYASSRRLYGNYMPTSASRFINELPEGSIKRVTSSASQGSSYSSGRQPWQKQQTDSWAPRKTTPLFKAESNYNRADADGAEDGLPIGDRVFHDKFGYGRIRRKEGDGASLKVIIAFDKAGEKKLLASMANLKKV